MFAIVDKSSKLYSLNYNDIDQVVFVKNERSFYYLTNLGRRGKEDGWNKVIFTKTDSNPAGTTESSTDLPIASRNRLGGIKVGTGLDSSADGTLYNWAFDCINHPIAGYVKNQTPDVHPAQTIYGDIHVTGNIYATNEITAYSTGLSGSEQTPLEVHSLQIASDTVLGHIRIKPNGGLSIDPITGEVSVTGGILTDYYNKVESDARYSLLGHEHSDLYDPLGRGASEAASAKLEHETAYNHPNYVRKYTSDTPTSQTIYGDFYVTGNIYATDEITAYSTSSGGGTSSPLEAHSLLIASPTVLGHVKVGSGLGIDSTGILSVTGNFASTWGTITGTLSNQTDLNNVLTAKADLVNGLIPSSQLPSYVDDVLEYSTYASLPTIGESGKIYVTLDTNLTYRWTGSVYTDISKSLVLGTTSSTAFRGDYGNTAYSYSQIGHLPYSGGSMANTNLVTNMNADLLDGLHSGYFARVYGSEYSFGNDISNITTAQFITMLANMDAFSHGYWAVRGSWCYAGNQIITDTGCGSIHLAGCTVEVIGNSSAYTIRIHTPTTAPYGTVSSEFIYVNNGSDYSPGWRKIWNSINDGTGSGLDADLLDGYHISSIMASKRQLLNNEDLDALTEIGSYVNVTRQGTGSSHFNTPYGVIEVVGNGSPFGGIQRSYIAENGELQYRMNWNGWQPWRKVWDDKNSNLPTVDWAANSITAAGVLRLNLANSGTNAYHQLNRNAITTENMFEWLTNGVPKWFIGQRSGFGEDSFSLFSVDIGKDALHVSPAGNLTASSNITAGGNIYAAGEVTAYYTSDANLKRNISNFSASDILDSLAPKTFNWNSKAKELNSTKDLDVNNFGLIAQDLQKVLPELVKPIYNKEYLAIDYIQLIPILVQVAKELKQEVLDLKKELEELKNRK